MPAQYRKMVGIKLREAETRESQVGRAGATGRGGRGMRGKGRSGGGGKRENGRVRDI